MTIEEMTALIPYLQEVNSTYAIWQRAVRSGLGTEEHSRQTAIMALHELCTMLTFGEE